jgi:hypothetical protein
LTDVGLDQPVHGQAAEPTDQLGMIADLLRAQDDPVVKLRHVVVEIGCGFRAQGKRSSGRNAQLSDAQKVQHAVLQHLGVRGHVFERTIGKACKHGIGHVSHPRLKRQQGLREPSLGDRPVHFGNGDVALFEAGTSPADVMGAMMD